MSESNRPIKKALPSPSRLPACAVATAMCYPALPPENAGQPAMRASRTPMSVRSLGGRLERLEHLAIEQSRQLAAMQECLERLSRRGDDVHDEWTRIRGDFQSRAEDLHALVYDLRASLDQTARASLRDPTARPSYPRVIRRIREAVRGHVPPGGTIIVATKGDEELLDLHGRRAWHFPQGEHNQ